MLTSLHRLTARPNRLICVYLHAVQLSLYSNRRSLLKKDPRYCCVCVCGGGGGGGVLFCFLLSRDLFRLQMRFFPPLLSVCPPVLPRWQVCHTTQSPLPV